MFHRKDGALRKGGAACRGWETTLDPKIPSLSLPAQLKGGWKGGKVVHFPPLPSPPLPKPQPSDFTAGLQSPAHFQSLSFWLLITQESVFLFEFMVRRKTEVLERRARTEFSASNANSLKAGPRLKLSWVWPPPRGLAELRVFAHYRWGPSQPPEKGSPGPLKA